MNLVKTRDEMFQSFLSGKTPKGVLEDYRTHRYSENWRTTLAVEELCEYILYLEDRLDTVSPADNTCSCAARSPTECCCGAWDDVDMSIWEG